MQQTGKRPFYGWWIVGAAIIFQYMAISVSQSIVGVFLDPVTTELGWQVWQFTLGPSLAIGIGALSGLYTGPWVDQRGPRQLILVGLVVTAVAFVGLGQQSDLVVYWRLNILSGLLGWNLFGPLIVNATLTKWFVTQRGWALSIGSIGVSLSSLITPLLMTAVIDQIGWRNGYVVMGVAVLAIGLPTAFVMRRRPEDFDLLPDGEPAPTEEAALSAARPVSRRSLTAKEAVRTTAFWLFVVGFALALAAISAVLFHVIPFVTGAGFTRRAAAFGLTLTGLGNLLSKPLWGVTLQRFNPKMIISGAFLTAAVGVALILVAASNGEIGVLYTGTFLFGFGFGGTIPVGEFLWASFFGREHIGAIRGISYPISIIGPTFLPVLIGAWFDATQSYQDPFMTIVACYLIAIVAILAARRPEGR